jgi:O-antigen/teichoic acid export membrane protein
MKHLGQHISKGLNAAKKSRTAHLRLLSLLDQILFSAGNFILTVTLARFYTDSEVTAYGIGLSISLLVQSTQRTCYIVQSSLLPAPIFVKRLSKVMGQHLVTWGCLLGLGAVVMAGFMLFFPSPFHTALAAVIVVTTLIYAQLSFDRIVLLKTGRIIDPFLSSLLFCGLNAALFFAARFWQIGFLPLMLIVGTYAALKIARLVWITGKPDFFWGWRMMTKANKRLLPSSILGIAGSSGFSEFPLFLLGAIAAPAQTAAFVAIRGLVQPLSIVVRSLDVIDKNFFQYSSVNGKSFGLRSAFLRQVRLYGALCLLTLLGSAAFGKPIVLLFYGERYAEFWPLIIGWAAYFSFGALSYPLETVIVKAGQLKRYNHLRLGAGAIGILLAFALCPFYGAYGAITACVVGWIASVGLGVWLVRDVLFPVAEDIAGSNQP